MVSSSGSAAARSAPVRRMLSRPRQVRGAELQGIAAGGIEAFRLVAAGQPENAVAGAEAELRIGVALHDRGDEGVDMGADIPGLLLQPGAGVLDAGALVRPGLVFPERGGAALGLAAEMAGDLPAPVHRSAQPHIDLLADILVGHRVEVPLDGDVVIGVDPVLAPLRALPAPVRQGPHVGEIDALETAVAVSRPCHRHRGAR